MTAKPAKVTFPRLNHFPFGVRNRPHPKMRPCDSLETGLRGFAVYTGSETSVERLARVGQFTQ